MHSRRTLVVVAPNGGRGGAQTVLRRLVAAATRSGWQVRCAVPGGPLAEDLVREGAEVRRVPDLGLPEGSRAKAMALLGLRSLVAARAIRAASSGADGILVNGLLGLPATVLSRPATPVVYLVHEVITRSDRLRLLRAMRHRVDAVIAVSGRVASALARNGIDARIVENGTPWPIEPAGDVRPRPPIVGCAASLTVGKGQHVLIDALHRMSTSDVSVELLGAPLPKDASYAAGLRSQVQELGLRTRVTFAGHVDDPLDTVRRWSVAVLASTEPEANPLSVLEAMSLGVPVVATDNGGAADTLGDAGLLVPAGDAGALAEALDRLLSSPAAWAACASAGPRLVAQHYALDDRLDELLQAIDEALERP